MINKKLMIFAIFLVSLLVVSAVSAADNVTGDIASADKTTDEIVGIDENQVILKENNNAGTFDDLQSEIDDATEGSVLNLTRDYNGHYGSRIHFNKDLTIDGQGHIIDCLGDDCSAFYSRSGTITLKNLKIINGHNDDDYEGGAIHIEGSAKYTIINCTFNNNWADDNGGAIYNSANPLTIINCSFNNNEVDDDHGGAIYSKGELYITNSIFTSNTADNIGGAICGVKYVSVENCVFESNYADIDGGAIYSQGDASVKNTTFRNNKVDGPYPDLGCGGAIYSSSSSSLTIEDCYFASNLAEDGGAIYTPGKVDVKNTIFVGNKAAGDPLDDDHGGAILCDNVKIVNCSFLDNRAGDIGGAIYAYDYVECVDSIFRGCYCENSGGAISAGKVDVKNTIFKNNAVTGDTLDSKCAGGAIESKVVKVDNCSFLNNFAYDYGGAIFAGTITWVDSPSYFIGNYIEDNHGGAIWTQRFSTDVKYAVFINNNAEAGGDGGAIYINDVNYITFSQCYFENNRCGDEGGAIYLNSEKSHVTLKSNVFANNWAEDKGNIVYNCGYYDYIGYNWFGENKFDFSNEIVEYKRWTSDNSHTDGNMLQAVMYMDENVIAGKEANLTIYFSNGNTLGDLFNINPIFSVDNGAVFSDWHSFNGSAYVRGITLNNIDVTHITAQVNNQILKLDATSSKANLALNASAEPITVGENATVIVTGLKNAEGDVSVVVNFTEWTGKIDKGVAKIIVSGLKESTTAVVTFYSDDNYNPAQTTVNITVNPKPKENLTVEAVAKPMTVGANATLIVTGLENATGNVTVTVNNKTYAAPIKDGKSKVLIPGITENVTAIVNYAGDERYNPASTTVNIIVNPAIGAKEQSKIYLRNALYFVTQTKMVKVTLWGASNRPMANKTVHITLNAHNLTYSGITDENGDAYIRVGVGFGVHNATVSFDGDDMYAASSRTGQIRVIKETPSVMVRGDNQQFRANDNPKIVKVYLWDRNSKPLPVNSKVAIKLNGITYIGYTDSNGIASIKINVNTRGIFNAQVTYAGNSAYKAVSRSVKFTIS